jgi:hypothetical protein
MAAEKSSWYSKNSKYWTIRSQAALLQGRRFNDLIGVGVYQYIKNTVNTLKIKSMPTRNSV